MSKYNALDVLIIDAISNEPTRFIRLFTGSIANECRRIAAEESDTEAFRVLDRRLQALRKNGKIRSTSRGWVEGDE